MPTGRDATKLGTATPAPAARWFGAKELQSQLDALTHSVARPSNQVELLVNGKESYTRRFQNIAEADLVLMKTYNFRDDETGHKMVEALGQRLDAGGKVFLQFDIKGYYKNPVDVAGTRLGWKDAIPPMLKVLVDKGATVIPTNLPTSLAETVFIKDHEKYLITWKMGESPKVVMGGMNIGDEWAFGGDPTKAVPSLEGHAGFRDTDVQLTGPITRDAIQEYVADVAQHSSAESDASQALQHALGEMKEAGRAPREVGSSSARFVSNSPCEGESGQNIEKLYCALMAAVPAGETVTLSTAFFLPTDKIVEGIEKAARRGVKFRLLLNSEQSPEAGFRLVAKGAQSLYRTLFEECPKGSLEIYEWGGNKEASGLHHKLASFGKDGPVMIGSSNLDYHSLR
ncbi:MAG: phosphatidylserine/phosphatidylglycerophosphate/cardiolipin synthase family protein, partial [Deltaproteobacteria bacterium]|nr:phosphatidylserine/phosphatidylglycerophosphate/cardiolipin synthase family protein [Deltaproteobacteria bacterium]